MYHINTHEDYIRAVKEIEYLMDAKPDTQAGEKLDALASLAEAWEEEHAPIPPT